MRLIEVTLDFLAYFWPVTATLAILVVASSINAVGRYTRGEMVPAIACIAYGPAILGFGVLATYDINNPPGLSFWRNHLLELVLIGQLIHSAIVIARSRPKMFAGSVALLSAWLSLNAALVSQMAITASWP